jgi:hypothetical protein
VVESSIVSSGMQRGWNIQDGNIIFLQTEEKSPAHDLQSVELIDNALTYAREIERIV